MADNVILNSGAGGATAAADDIGGVHHQRVKISVGADGAASDAIPVSNGLDTTAVGVQAVGIVGQLDDVGTGAVTENQFAPVRITTARRLMTSATVDAALPAGTNAIGKLAANSGVDIGDVDVTSSALPTGAATSAKQDTIIGHVDGIETIATAVQTAVEIMDDWDESDRAKVNPIVGQAGVQGASGVVTALTQRVVLATDVALPTGANAIGKLAANSGVDIGDVDVTSLPNVTLAAGTNTNEVVGDIAHDTGVSGNPVQTAGAAQDMDDTAPPNRVSAESDVTRFATDRDGTQFVHPHGPQVWSYHSDGSSALTDASVHGAPGAGLSIYITDIVVSTGAATAMNVFFEEGASKVLGPYYLEAVAGRGLCIHFQTPKKITANTAVTVTTSAAIAQAVDVTGFVAQG